jgi:hypothetical protein
MTETSYSPGYYAPLAHVISRDDFDDGMRGWLDLRPNFVDADFRPRSREVDSEHWGSVMLSSATFPFSGTHGSATGTYSLRLSTRRAAAPADRPPATGSMSLGIKRLSCPPDARLLRVEATIAYTTEQDRPGLGIDALRSFGLFIDLQDAEHRYMPGVRFVNAVDGAPVRRWQYYRVTESNDDDWNYGRAGWHQAGVDPQWFGRRYPDGSTDATAWFDSPEQHLIYNESDDKINWMPLALTVDLQSRTYVSFRVHDREFAFPPGAGPSLADPYANIGALLNPVFFVETDSDRRVSLFVDSVVISYSTDAEHETVGSLR